MSFHSSSLFSLIKGFIYRHEEYCPENAYFLDHVRCSFLKNLRKNLPKSVLDKSWPTPPPLCIEVQMGIKQTCGCNHFSRKVTLNATWSAGIGAPAEAAHEKHGGDVLQESPTWVEEAGMWLERGSKSSHLPVSCMIFSSVSLDAAEGHSQWDFQRSERQLPAECWEAVPGLQAGYVLIHATVTSMTNGELEPGNTQSTMVSLSFRIEREQINLKVAQTLGNDKVQVGFHLSCQTWRVEKSFLICTWCFPVWRSGY